MSGKHMVRLAGFCLAIWHAASLIKDAERCKLNLARYNANPAMPNLVKLALAEGALIGDLRWL